MTLDICKSIRKVKYGYIVELRYPYGDQPGRFGEVVCCTWSEVVERLSQAADLRPEEYERSSKIRDQEALNAE